MRVCFLVLFQFRTSLFWMGSPYRSNDSGSLLTRDPLPLAISLADAAGGFHRVVVVGMEEEDPWCDGNHEDDEDSGTRGPAVHTAAVRRAAAAARPKLACQSGGSDEGSRDGGVDRRRRREDEDSRNGEDCDGVWGVRIRWCNDAGNGDDTHAQLPSRRLAKRPRSSGSTENTLMVFVDASDADECARDGDTVEPSECCLG